MQQAQTAVQLSGRVLTPGTAITHGDRTGIINKATVPSAPCFHSLPLELSLAFREDIAWRKIGQAMAYD